MSKKHEHVCEGKCASKLGKAVKEAVGKLRAVASNSGETGKDISRIADDLERAANAVREID